MRMPAAMTWLVLLSIAGAGRAAGERADPCAGAAATAWEIIGERYGGRDFDASSWAAREPAPDDSADTLLLALDDPAVRHLDADQAAALLDQFTGSPRPGVGLFELLSIDASETAAGWSS